MEYDIRLLYKKYLADILTRIISSRHPGDVIREIRMERGLTQGDVAELVGVRRETVARIENKHVVPTYEFVKNFSRVIALMMLLGDLYVMQETRGNPFINLRQIARMFDFPDRIVFRIYELEIQKYIREKSEFSRRIGRRRRFRR